MLSTIPGLLKVTRYAGVEYLSSGALDAGRWKRPSQPASAASASPCLFGRTTKGDLVTDLSVTKSCKYMAAPLQGGLEPAWPTALPPARSADLICATSGLNSFRSAQRYLADVPTRSPSSPPNTQYDGIHHSSQPRRYGDRSFMRM
jgi:hypothetical protein